MKSVARVLMVAGLVAIAGCKGDGVASGDIVARVGDKVITQAQFDKEVEKSLSRYRSLGRVNQPAIETRIKQNVLRRMVDNMIYDEKARALGVTLDDAAIAAKLEEHKQRFGGDQAFDEYLKRTHNSLEDLRDDIRYNLLRERLVEKLGASTAVTEEEVKDHYEKNKSRYVEPEQVQASHILFKIDKAKFLDPKALEGLTPEQRQKAEAEAQEKAKADALSRAKKVLPLAKKKGADFAALATKHGEDPTAPKGGDLGYFNHRRMVKQFSDVAFAMKPGEVSDLVETRFGFHIIKVFDHKPETQKPLAEVADSIQKSLLSRKQNEQRREVLKKLKDEVKVEILAKFEAPEGPGPMRKMNLDRPGMGGDLPLKVRGPGMPGMPGMPVPGGEGPMDGPMAGPEGLDRPDAPPAPPAQ